MFFFLPVWDNKQILLFQIQYQSKKVFPKLRTGFCCFVSVFTWCQTKCYLQSSASVSIYHSQPLFQVRKIWKQLCWYHKIYIHLCETLRFNVGKIAWPLNLFIVVCHCKVAVTIFYNLNDKFRNNWVAFFFFKLQHLFCGQKWFFFVWSIYLFYATYIRILFCCWFIFFAFCLQSF